jgi:apolipoprotein N-acyltransferase
MNCPAIESSNISNEIFAPVFIFFCVLLFIWLSSFYLLLHCYTKHTLLVKNQAMAKIGAAIEVEYLRGRKVFFADEDWINQGTFKNHLGCPFF